MVPGLVLHIKGAYILHHFTFVSRTLRWSVEGNYMRMFNTQKYSHKGWVAVGIYTFSCGLRQMSESSTFKTGWTWITFCGWSRLVRGSSHGRQRWRECNGPRQGKWTNDRQTPNSDILADPYMTLMRLIVARSLNTASKPIMCLCSSKLLRELWNVATRKGLFLADAKPGD